MTRNCETIRQPQHQQRAFTLIEILVTITIIVLLLGLLMVGLRGASDTTDIKLVEGEMKKLIGVHTEYRAQTGTHLNFNTVDPPNPQAAQSIAFFIERMMSVPETRQMILGIDKELWADIGNGSATYEGSSTVVPQGLPGAFKDPWGNYIQFRSWSDGSGPISFPRRGSSSHHQPFFASAGPDGDFGTTDNANKPVNKLAEDNIYSFDLN